VTLALAVSEVDLKEKIRLARKHHRPTLNREEIAKRTGVSSSTVGMYETGDRKPPEMWVSRFADSLGIPLQWFYDGKPGPPPERNIISNVEPVDLPGKGKYQINLVPYWGVVPCGHWAAPVGEPEWVQVTDSIDAEGCRAVRVSGDSMEPRLSHGQLVVIRLSPEPREGVITLAKNGDGELTLKVLRYCPNGWELHSLNPSYPPTTADTWEILGYAVAIEEANPHGIRP
jgi:SOS-response transcriptional repressor LexA